MTNGKFNLQFESKKLGNLFCKSVGFKMIFDIHTLNVFLHRIPIFFPVLMQ